MSATSEAPTRLLDDLALELVAARSWLTPRRPDAFVVATVAEGPNVQLSLLGQWRLTIDAAPVPIPDSARKLLARLALGGRQARLHLAGTLWGDVDDERAMGRLRTVLSRLQRVSRHLVVASEGHLALGPLVEVDAADVLALARRCSEPGDGLDHRSARAAIDRLDGPELLPGWYDDWVLAERDRLAQVRLQALEDLSELFLAAGQAAAALRAALAATRVDPLCERAQRAAIRAHVAADNPASALRAYRSYCQRLQAELGIRQPSAALVSLVDGLRAALVP